MDALLDMFAQGGPVKRVLDDTRKRFQTIYDSLDQCQISALAGEKLLVMARAVLAGDLKGVKEAQQELSSAQYDQNKYWLVGVHRALSELERQGKFQG